MLKRDFGSFHVSNVDELLHMPENVYKSPQTPFEVAKFPYSATEDTDASFTFGKDAKKKHFFLEEQCTFLNHGAFGGSLREAVLTAQSWQVYIEKQPLRFFDRELMPHLVHVIRRLAKFVGCAAHYLVLVPNVTTAVNCVTRSLKLTSQDSIAHLSVEYGAVKTILREISATTGAAIEEIFLPLPLQSASQISDCIVKNLSERTRLLVIDHIPSNTPYIAPLRDIIDICHKRNVLVLVDGAHALGQVDLDLRTLGADFYTSNCHKWFCSVKGAAFLYVDTRHHSSIQPLVISHGYRSGFNSAFIWSGLRDYSPFLALHTNLDFWESVGPTRIREYNTGLARQAAEALVEAWQTCLLAPVEITGSLLCVRLPMALYDNMEDVNYDVAEKIQNILYHKYNIEVPIKAVQGHLYVRISVHIYNHLEEYKQLADAVRQITTDTATKQ